MALRSVRAGERSARVGVVVRVGFAVAAVLAAAFGCSPSGRQGSGGAGGGGTAAGGTAGGSVGGAAGTPTGGGGDAGHGESGGASGAAAAAGHGGGGGVSTTPNGEAGKGGGSVGGGAVAGRGGSPSNPCGDTRVCTVGAIRCVMRQMQICQLDENGCELWGPTGGQPTLSLPDCPANHLVCNPVTGEPACDCPTLTSPLCGPDRQSPPKEGDYCVTSGTTTFATCRVVDGCYVETKDLACPSGTVCKQAASLQLVSPGTACE